MDCATQALEKYNIDTSLDEIAAMSKERFRAIVNTSVKKLAFRELTEELKRKKKTQDLHYKELALQKYLLEYYPGQARTIFKCRSQTLDLKTNLSYKYKDSTCRLCGAAEETVSHAINCGCEETLVWNFQDLSEINSTNSKRSVKRLETFLENVADL